MPPAEGARRRLHHGLGLARGRDADGVGDVDLVAAQVAHAAHHVGHGIQRHLALVGAAERAADAAAQAQAVFLGGARHRFEARDRFGDRAVDVLLREGFRGRAEDHDFIGAARQRRLETLHVRRQRRIDGARTAFDAAMTSALVAICGTHFGDTKDAASTLAKPARDRRSTSSIFTAADTASFSFCSPSRGPTSTILTLLRQASLLFLFSIAACAVDDVGHGFALFEQCDLGRDLAHRVHADGQRRDVRGDGDARLFQNGCGAGSGSLRNTSSVAPAMWPSRIMASRSGSATWAPRATLTR
jgi:hypothetical protein